MYKTLTLSLVTLAAAAANAHNTTDSITGNYPEGFTVTEIGKTAWELCPDSVSPSTPLDFYRLRSWVGITGKKRLWADISTKRFDFDRDAADAAVDSALRKRMLDERVKGIVTYRDSAAVIVVRNSPDYLILNWTWIEDGRWVNGGQGLAENEQEMTGIISRQLPNILANIPRIDLIHRVPADVTPFTSFLAGVKDTPEEFLLKRLRDHRLVINGEYHRRKVSWDMLRRLIALPGFPETAGTVFMELPSWRQPDMDAFMASDTLDTQKVLDIFRDEQPNGWWDRGEFDFLCDLWSLNHSLAPSKKIKVVLADYQIPYSRIKTMADTEELEDRNTHMADVIERYMSASADPRHCLFLVGCGHASKTDIPGTASTPRGMTPALTAGAQLAQRLGENNVFSVMQHSLSTDNSGRHPSKPRGGIFDRAFELNGNSPVGFTLKGSPFGNEPYDGMYEMKYDHRAGTYADNFDGFLFLYPLDNEPRNTPLMDVFSQSFIDEMKRRAEVLGLNDRKWIWFGTTADDMTIESIARALGE